MNLNHDINRIHRDELMREAEQERLIRKAQNGIRKGNPVLNAVGHQMIRFGERLIVKTV